MKVALGVGGGIAAYKAAELARALGERGCTVEVIMTEAAREFIQPLTFASLTGRKVITGLWADQDRSGDGVLSSAVEHIRVAQENDVLVVAPATANLIASFAHGLAGDFLTTLYLAFTGRVVIAPAMNTNMWQHPATVANIRTLRERGHEIVEPDAGLLACGVVGPGRLAEPIRIAEFVVAGAKSIKRDLDGETVVITAGPTQEPIDPVRFISNRSSGKMGYALAEAAAARGARVVLISGPVSIAPPAGVELVRVQTALQMRSAVLEHLPASTIIVKAAAVADYHVADVPKQKMKKTAMRLTLDLEPTIDILAEVGQKKGDRLLIGFAAETQNLIEEARRKMSTKKCDMVVGNNVGQSEIGFGSDENEVVLVLRTGENIEIPRASKRDVSDAILDQTLRLRLAMLRHATP
ncbi:MAG TPA: bifunctional phosphopantothenoylcysteine decarboxylase/phosphopantothenate--cysteine ligase CoaBC [Bryobacteraceae bacterium]|nr:bifunctional phosphopantothenoylcysteine decarboxylase/phosphopantothenate--cysteine ligase CoaBC [Bryobacteraceae bacterium]